MKHKQKRSLIKSFNLLKPKSKLIVIYGFFLGLGILGLSGYALYKGAQTVTTIPTAGNVAEEKLCVSAGFGNAPFESNPYKDQTFSSTDTNIPLMVKANASFDSVQVTVVNTVTSKPICVNTSDEIRGDWRDGNSRDCMTPGTQPLLWRVAVAPGTNAVLNFNPKQLFVRDLKNNNLLADRVKLVLQLHWSGLPPAYTSAFTANCDMVARQQLAVAPPEDNPNCVTPGLNGCPRETPPPTSAPATAAPATAVPATAAPTVRGATATPRSISTPRSTASAITSPTAPGASQSASAAPSATATVRETTASPKVSPAVLPNTVNDYVNTLTPVAIVVFVAVILLAILIGLVIFLKARAVS